MIRPWWRIAIRSASCSASSRYWVVSSTVVPCPASSSIACHTVTRACGSSPVVGSSRKITGGFPMRLIAMSRRRRIPPEYVATLRSAASASANRSSRSSAIRRRVRQVSEPCHQHEVLPPAEDLVDCGELSGETDRLPHLGRLVPDVEAVDARGPSVGLEQRRQDSHDVVLPAPFEPEQCEDAPGRDLEVHARQHLHLPERLLQAMCPDGWIRGLADRHLEVRPLVAVCLPPA